MDLQAYLGRLGKEEKRCHFSLTLMKALFGRIVIYYVDGSVMENTNENNLSFKGNEGFPGPKGPQGSQGPIVSRAVICQNEN